MQYLSQKIWRILGLKKTATINLVLVNKRKIRDLNRQWRNKDKTTDILSFSYQESQNHSPLPKSGTNLLGELILCPEQINQQARLCHHSFKTELTGTLVHGILHLLGYNHQTAAGHQKMNNRAQEIIRQLQLKELAS